MNNKDINYGESNNLNLKVLVTLSRATQVVHKRSIKIFNEGGLTSAQFAVLEVLYHKGDLRISEIIEKILSTGGNMTVVINNLEKEQLVEKHIDPNDKRATLIRITEKGKGKIEEIFPVHLRDLDEHLSPLSAEEKNLLRTLLKKLGTK